MKTKTEKELEEIRSILEDIHSILATPAVPELPRDRGAMIMESLTKTLAAIPQSESFTGEKISIEQLTRLAVLEAMQRVLPTIGKDV